MRTPHKGTLWENSVDFLDRRREVLAKIREQETNCRRFDIPVSGALFDLGPTKRPSRNWAI